VNYKLAPKIKMNDRDKIKALIHELVNLLKGTASKFIPLILDFLPLVVIYYEHVN